MAKNILGSVGEGGANQSQSVKVVQYLLNCVPGGSGGPGAELAVDGMIGPKTVAAIRKFQMAKFGKADGRVDLNGATIKALQGFDPHPNDGLGALSHKTPHKESGAPGKTPSEKMGGDWWKSPGGDKMGGVAGKTPSEKMGGEWWKNPGGDKMGGTPGHKSPPTKMPF